MSEEVYGIFLYSVRTEQTIMFLVLLYNANALIFAKTNIKGPSAM